MAQHLVAIYTTPGSTVLAVGRSARTVARTAAQLDRRPPRRDSHGRARPGSVDLLVITPPATDVGTRQDGTGLWRRWSQLLAPTGMLAVVLAPTRAPGDPAAVVAAATAADLAYLQHIVAILWPLHDDHLDPPHGHPHPAETPGGQAEMDAPHGGAPDERGLPAAHADILIFTCGTADDESPVDASDTQPGQAARPNREGRDR
jgi:hypothetical protein